MPALDDVDTPDEQEDGHSGVSGRERILEIAAALLLAITTVCVAWSGYLAAKWSGVQAREYTAASTDRAFANRAQTRGSQARVQDLLNFNRWLEALQAGDVGLARLYEQRFRDEFVPAFEAWRAQGDPLVDDIPIATPLRMAEYRLASEVRSNELEAAADQHFETGKGSTEHADQYVFVTVFFAVVLFLSGVSLRFDWWRLRVAMISGAGLFLAWGIVQLFSLPVR